MVNRRSLVVSILGTCVWLRFWVEKEQRLAGGVQRIDTKILIDGNRGFGDGMSAGNLAGKSWQKFTFFLEATI